MKKEAEANADQDRQEKESIEKINQADSMIFQTEKQIKEFSDKLTEDSKNSLNESLEKLKDAYNQRDLIKIDDAMNNMNETWNKVSTEMYQNSNKSETVEDDAPVGEA